MEGGREGPGGTQDNWRWQGRGIPPGQERRPAGTRAALPRVPAGGSALRVLAPTGLMKKTRRLLRRAKNENGGKAGK